jgi:hypothetical protein
MPNDPAPVLAGTNDHDRRFVARMISLHESSGARPNARIGEELRELMVLAERLGVDVPPAVEPPPPDVDTRDRHVVSLALRELAEGGDRRVRGFARRVLAARVSGRATT